MDDGVDEWIVVGEIDSERISIPEAEFEDFRARAEEEGVSLDEFTDQLGGMFPYLSAMTAVRIELSDIDLSDDSPLPSSEEINALHSLLVDAEAAAPPYPFEEFYAWLPRTMERVKETLSEVVELLERNEKVTAVLDELSEQFSEETLSMTVEELDAQTRLYLRQLVEYVEALPLPDREELAAVESGDSVDG